MVRSCSSALRNVANSRRCGDKALDRHEPECDRRNDERTGTNRGHPLKVPQCVNGQVIGRMRIVVEEERAEGSLIDPVGDLANDRFISQVLKRAASTAR